MTLAILAHGRGSGRRIAAMSNSTAILARRTPSEILITDGATRAVCRWERPRSRDGQQIVVEFEAKLACADSAADRQLLAERFLGGDASSVTVQQATAYLATELETPLRRAVAEQDVASLMSGAHDESLTQLLATRARQVAFAAGLSVEPPLSLRIDSPSLRREQHLAQVQKRLAELAESSAAKSRGVADLAEQLTAATDATVAAEVVATRRLADPLDLLRAASIADPRWDAPTPRLHVAVGDRTATIAAAQSGQVGATRSSATGTIGALRSVRDASVDGAALLLVGGRSGVAAIDPQTHQVVRSFRFDGSSEFGFNAVAFRADDRRLLATHSAYGVVGWSWDAVDGEGVLEPVDEAADEGCRGAIALDGSTVLFVAGTRLVWSSAAHGVRVGAPAASRVVELAMLNEGLVAVAYEDRTLAVVDAHAGTGGSVLMQTRVASPIVSITGVDVCGLSRVAVATEAGQMLLVDPATGESTLLGPPRLPARTIRSRPGLVAVLSPDRTRVNLIDLSRPDASATEVHLAVAYGSRAADLWFA